ncbi:hypothetical protein JCM11491_003704 [Sporobolomyces phaffii]
MPSRSRPSSPSDYPKEKPYDDRDQSSDEDFVNAAATPRPSSRTSAASAGSRSARKPAIVSESSEETDSEEERDLQDDLRDTVGIETGSVRGAPVETTGERIMRSVGKSSNSQRSSQRYASLAAAEEGRRHHGKHKAKKSKEKRAYELGTAPGSSYPGASNDALKGKKSKSGSKRIWCWVFGGIIALLLIAAIVAAVVILVKRKSGGSASDDDDLASNSTSLANNGNSSKPLLNSTMNGHVSPVSTGLGHASSAGDRVPLDGSLYGNASPANPATYDDGKYRPSTGIAAASTGHATLGGVGEDQPAGTGLGGGVATKGVDDVGAADGSHVSPPVPTQAQNYGAKADDGRGQQLPSGFQTGLPLGSGPTGVTPLGPQGVASIQTAPNANPSLAPDAAGQAMSPASNAGQWNALSDMASQGSQAQGGVVTKPTFGQAQGSEGSPTHHLGVGPVVPSATGSVGNDNRPPVAAIGGIYNNDQPESIDGSQPIGAYDASQPAQPVSPVDSTAPGPFTAGEFKQATHPEPFQTYVNSPGTWFESSGHYGACGLATNNTDFVVAINDALWLESTKGSATAQSPHCGAEVLLTSLADGATVNAWVTERCAYCSNEGSGGIDLSKAAFSALAGGSTDAGTLDLVWGFTGNRSTPTPSTAAAAGSKGASGATPTSKSSFFDNLFGSSDESEDSSEELSSATKAPSASSGMLTRRSVIL